MDGFSGGEGHAEIVKDVNRVYNVSPASSSSLLSSLPSWPSPFSPLSFTRIHILWNNSLCCWQCLQMIQLNVQVVCRCEVQALALPNQILCHLQSLHQLWGYVTSSGWHSLFTRRENTFAWYCWGFFFFFFNSYLLCLRAMPYVPQLQAYWVSQVSCSYNQHWPLNYKAIQSTPPSHYVE